MSSKSFAAVRAMSGALALAAASVGVQAAPVAVSSPPPLAAGFTVDWALATTAPHAIAAAQAVLAAPAATAQQTLVNIDLTDLSVPFAGSDPAFAVRVTGYVNLAAGTYTFSSLHDDGMKLTLGGEDIIVFDSDTSPTTTLSAPYTLAAGVYAVDLLGWEQGGAFVLDLRAQLDNGRFELLDGLHATRGQTVPEPGSLALVLASLAGLAWRRRR